MENQIIKHLKEYMENTSDEQFEKDIEELIKKLKFITYKAIFKIVSTFNDHF